MSRHGVLYLFRAAVKGAVVGFLAWLIIIGLLALAAWVLSGKAPWFEVQQTAFLATALLLGVLFIGGETFLSFLSARTKRQTPP
jgi:hypothetical protein